MPPVPLIGPTVLLPGTSPTPYGAQSRVGLAARRCCTALQGTGAFPETAAQTPALRSTGRTLPLPLRHRDGGHLLVQTSLDL